MNVQYYQFKKYFKGKKVIFVLSVPKISNVNINADDFAYLPGNNELRISEHNKLGEQRFSNISENDFEVVNIINRA